MEIKTDDESNGLVVLVPGLTEPVIAIWTINQSIRQIIQIQIQIYVTKIHTFSKIQPNN